MTGPSWDDMKEVFSDAMSLALTLLVLVTLIMLAPTGWWGAREPNGTIVIIEIVAVTLVAALGLERLVNDVRKRGRQ